MRKRFLNYGLATAMLIGLGLGGAEAAATRPISPEAFGLDTAAMPAAMCGFSCRSGGRYIPGPPSVCYERGLNYCGRSQGWGGPPRGPGYDDRGPYGRGPGPYGGGGGYGRGPGRYDEGADGGRRGGPGGQGAYERGPDPSEGRASRGGPAPSTGSAGGRGPNSQDGPYGYGPGRCGSSLC
jgi:hypothetical protein